MDYFTSDLHIGHDKEFLWKPRGYSSVEEHDTAVLLHWNEIIQPEDTVYILGDLCMSGNEKEWDRVFKYLKGHIKFIHGNHDTDNKIDLYINKYNMEDLGIAYVYRYNKHKKFYLSHYPTLVNNHDDKFFYNLSGHLHSCFKWDNWAGGVYNVSLDAHNMYPVSIEQIIKDIKHKRGD